MSAPSFSSFPASFSSFPDLTAGSSKRSEPTSDREEDRNVKGRKQTDKHRDKKEKKEKKREKHARHGDKHRKESGELYRDERIKGEEDRKLRDKGDIYEHSVSSVPLFYSDRKGDSLNVRYGGLHAGDVPRYHLVGRGKKILGLNYAWSVVHRSGKGIEIALGGRRKLPTLTDSSSRTLLRAAPTRRLLASTSDTYKYEEVDGFLRLSSGLKPKDDQSYRSITEEQQPFDSDFSDSSESEADDDDRSSDESPDTPQLTSQQIKIKDLEHELSADPSSIPTWLSLLSYSLSNVPITSKNATKARSEITLSVLSRALSAHPDNRGSIQLRLKYLKAGEETWHESKLRAEWEDALKATSGVDIWLEWLDWRIRKTTKNVDELVEDATRALARLSGDEIGSLRAIWRVTVAFAHSGFLERAMAVFQAQAELTFEIPQSLYGLPLDTQLDALEEFWESEVPRVGEPDSQGWAAWLASGRPDHEAVPAPTSISSSSVESDPYRRWSQEESQLDRTRWVPSRSTDNTEDPYATILFSDIRPLLLSLGTPEGKNAFRLIWVSLLGLHIPGFAQSLSTKPGINSDDRWAYTHLVTPPYLEAILPSDLSSAKVITADSHAGVLIGKERQYSSAFGPVKNWGYGVIGFLECIDRRTKFPKAVMWGPEDTGAVDLDIVRRVFAQCRFGGIDGEDADWDTLALAFEAAVNIKNALKLSRSFLSTARDSLSHWAAHARLERLRGRAHDARKVYHTVLIAGPTRPGTERLWWDWAEMEWLSGRSEVAQYVCLRSVGVESKGGEGGVVVLRGKRELEERAAQADEWKESEGWIKLRTLLELLTSSPEAALTVSDKVSGSRDDFVPGSVAHESLTVAILVVLYHYSFTLKNPSPPGTFRDRVHAAVDRYPDNTVILGMFLETEKGQGVWGRLRNYLCEGSEADVKTRIKSLSRRAAEVWIGGGWEKGRWESEKERIRNGLSVAVQDDRTRGSPILWRLYAEFELRAGNLKRAKDILFRSVGECPLVKELYLLAFGPLRTVFTAQELDGWAETMAERGIRMRKGLDEMLEGWTDQDLDRPRVKEGENADDGDYGDEDIEYRAQELRRLMPYS